jgi:UDP:flavonoid glycosyltransferase YjiC (YdhE family)
MNGVPLVCVPGLGRDQCPIARRVEELGMGVAVKDPASIEEIHNAAFAVLEDGGYRRRAQAFQLGCQGVNGSLAAANALETLGATRP